MHCDVHAVIAQPDFSAADADCIAQTRAAHDRLYYPRLPPRFMLVYPFESSLALLRDEVRARASEATQIDLTLASAAVHKDHFNSHFHVSLMPDLGLGELLRLYYALHAVTLRQQLLIEANYVPHLTIGNTEDPQAGLELARRWNSRAETIRATVRELHILVCQPGAAPQLVDTVPLRPKSLARREHGACA